MEKFVEGYGSFPVIKTRFLSGGCAAARACAWRIPAGVVVCPEPMGKLLNGAA